MDAQRPQRTMFAYEKALLWRELFELAQLQKVDHEDVVAMAYRVAGMRSLAGLAMFTLMITL